MRASNFGWASLFLLLVACGGQSETGGTGGGGTGGAAASGGGGSSGGGGAGGGTGGGGAVGGSGGAVGGSGGAVGGSGGVGGGTGGFGGSAGGSGGAPCDALDQAYATALNQAKACSATAGVNECTGTVQDQLACPCGPTYVNPANTDAMKTLGELKAQWDKQNCSYGVMCPAIACEIPALGACQANASGAYGCVDMFTNGG